MKLSILIAIFLTSTFSLISADYYWVDGSGDWSDISHWKTSSGGSVGHSQAPGPEDDVFFDQNSFTGPNQIVTFNNDINFCRSFTWTGVTNNPRIVGGKEVSLSIYGSIDLDPMMVFDFQGKILLTGSDLNKTINFGGHSAGPALLVDGSGSWTFQNEIVVDSMLEILMGEVDFNDQNVSVDHFYIDGVGTKTVNLGSSQIEINGKFLDEMYVDDFVDIKSCVINTNNLTLNAGTSKLTFTAKDPALWFLGEESVALNDLEFLASTGNTNITDWYFDPSIAFNNLLINSNARIEGRIETNRITLNGGSVYEFQSDETFRFNAIEAMGDCAKGVIVTSTNNGIATNFNVPSGNIDLDFITLRDVNAIGGATFSANNGVDLGNNSGWSFTNSNPQDFFWINGSGNWSDPQHWSFTSGGSPSGCVPTGKDDVFFDANSFSATNQIVEVDKENIYMKSMTWDMVNFQPTFQGDEDFKVRITGSLEFDENMQNAFMGDFYFESGRTGNSLRMNQNIFQRNIYFNGIDGEWLIQDSLEANHTIYFTSGKIVSNGNTITCTRFLGESDLPRTLDVRNSYIHLRQFMNDYPYLTFSLFNYNLIADNSTFEFTSGYYGSFFHYGEYPNGGIPKFHKIIFSNYIGNYGINNWGVPDGEAMAEIDSLIYNTRGEVFGSNRINYLQLRAGHDYSFDSWEERFIQEIGSISASGTCGDGTTRLFGHAPGSKAKFELSSDIILEKVSIQDLQILGSGSLQANNSVDEGRNTNITFTDLAARTLYWVGDGGNWEDEQHWSLSSGGSGGECIPTAIDDVIFDENSFTMNGQYVGSETGAYRYCHDISWRNATNDPEIGDSYLIISGSIDFDDSFRYNVWQTIMTSSENEIVESRGQNYSLITFRGSGEVSFKDDLTAYEFYQQSGNLHLDNISIALNSMFFDYNAEKVFDLQNSKLLIQGSTGDANYPPFRDYSNGHVTILPGNSEIEFTGMLTGMFLDNQVEFNKIVFSNPQGEAYLLNHYINDDNPTTVSTKASSIVFNGNGNVVGRIQTDTLIGAPGKTYVLEQGKVNNVERYLQMIGNNCTPIELRSSSQGQKTIIEMPASGEIVANFVQMQDNEGRGGADFNAGSRSTDIDNSNIGWYFDDTPEIAESGFLGDDRALCTGEDLVLDAYSFSPNEVYLWNDGSMDSTITVSDPGVYFVEVQFESSCILRDTIEIFTAQDIMAMLPANPEACEGEVVVLDAEIAINTAEYTWNDGSTEASLEVTESGTYSVEIDVDGCTSSAFSEVLIISNPGVDLGDDQSFCEGSEFTLESPIVASNYLWQDGSTNASLLSSLPGTYWLEIDEGGCKFRDSIEVSEVALPFIDLGQDTMVCDNEEFILMLSNPNNFLVSWQDGSSENSIAVSSPGQYKVALNDNGCVNLDSIEIGFIAAPMVDLGENETLCEGEVFDLIAPNPNLDFVWEDGTSDVMRNIEASGIYAIEVEENNCFASDEIEINFTPNPIVNLGQDTTVCDDIPFTLSVPSNGTQILWGDGSSQSTFLVSNPGEIKVTVIDGECMASDSINVAFKECINFDVFIPTAFSPNQDGYNDLFEVYFSKGLIIESFEMIVFDRWGTEVFTSKEYGDFWDGTYQSDFLKTGVYTYFMQVSYIDDFGPDETSISGDITIID